MATSVSPPAPLLLIIRFTTSTPDLPLPISTPSTTTTLTLKRLIRSHLPPESSTHRLRLIHAGRVLPDTSTLSNALKLPPPPPRVGGGWSSDVKGKGKAVVRDEGLLTGDGEKGSMTDREQQQQQRVYIHCSIGDDLSPTELDAETAAEEAAVARIRGRSSSTADDETLTSDGKDSQGKGQQQQGPQGASTTTTPAPRGFDRLLTAGFTPQEILTLRSQFLALQAHTHTPDTMPSPAEMRVLEDRWIDESVNADGGTGSGPLTGGADLGDDAQSGGLEDMLWGNIMGFFWPLGAVVWLLREEGVWSKRRQIAVFTGFLVNLALSVVRVTT